MTKKTLFFSLMAMATAIYFLLPFRFERLRPANAYRFFDRHGELLAMLPASDGFIRVHSKYDELPQLFIQALLLKEDRHFRVHPGVNVFAILRAAVTNVSAGRVVSGGSTITMQLARMLDRQPRSILAKFREALRSIKLEMHYSKDELLSLYLANAPYGGRIEGVEAASYRYFGKSARRLSVGEIALLVAIPRSPNQLRPDRHPQRARKARDRVLRTMLQGNLITESVFFRAQQEPVTGRTREVKNQIPHLSWKLRLQKPDRHDWRLTLDKATQERVSRLVKLHIASLGEFNIRNAAAVVIDNETRQIRAYVGSADYYSLKDLGANDGASAPRSPGSTLKPFVFALSADEGLISEKTILYDIPVNYAGYSPQNYSKNFVGLVTAREALIDSLNVVAVRLSQQLGVERLYHLLQAGGVSTLTEEPLYYGLPLVLGGVEVSLLELTNLYATFPNYGRYRNYRLTDDGSTAEEKSLFSPEAAWLISGFLQDVERPDFPESWRFSATRPAVSWKTGTSYAHQDAWSVGYTRSTTAGVWIGNFDGSPSIGLAGSKTAAPLLFDIIQAISQEKDASPLPQPQGIGERLVCETCGRPTGRFCKNEVKEYYIKRLKNKFIHKICEVPQKIEMNGQSRIFDIWPSEVATFLQKHGVPTRDAPPYDITRMAGEKYYKPEILTPEENTVYYLRLDRLKKENHSIKLAAAVTNRIRSVSWYIDEKLIAQVDPLQEVYINPDPGEYMLSVVDEVGGRDQVRLVVKDYREKRQEYEKDTE